MGSDPHNLIGKTLGTCTLNKLIGQGGMGAVYLAQQHRPSRQVAIKVLLPNVTTESQLYREFLARFRREADVIAKLEHVNIVPIYDYGEQDGLAYLIMPYLPGGSLRDVLERRGPLTLQEALPYISQAASALDYAHASQVIHRDLKPGNFLLHRDGRLLLADFGIARIVQDSNSTFAATLTSTGMLLGTPQYMAPEMLNGEKVDQKADIYALGIVLFQMLSGQVPFKGNTPFAVATKHLQEPPPSLCQINLAIPPSVNNVVQKALAKRPADRFLSAGMLAQALQEAINTSNYSSTDETYIPTRFSSPIPVSFTIAQAGPTPTFQTSPPTYANPVTQPNTAYGTSLPPPAHRQQPLLIVIGMLLVLVLVAGGVLVGLQLSKGTTGSSAIAGNTPSSGAITTANTPLSSKPTVATQTTSGGFTTGTWQGQGQGTCFNASCQFDMTLTVITINGKTFSGTLRENVYNTTVNISGTTNGDTISFTDTSYVSGNQIQLGCTYTGTVSNGKITGSWGYPNPQDGGGTLSLSLTS